MRTGVLGGTFDPPHAGHLALARAAIEKLKLDELIMLPVWRNPMKRGRQTPAKHRLEMVRLAIRGEPRVSVSDLEVGRGGASYAVDTLAELTHVRPGQYWFVMGADALKDFAQWKQPQRLLKMCRLAVALRNDQGREALLRALPAFATDSVDWIEMPPVDISATDLRQRIETGRQVQQWLSPDVLRYIEENKLYRT